jgi:hypothetical protein
MSVKRIGDSVGNQPTGGNPKSQIQTHPFFDPANVAKHLEANGWKKSVCDLRRGKNDEGVLCDDFANACNAVSTMFKHGRGCGLIISGEYGCGKTSLVRALKLGGFFRDMNVVDDRERLDIRGGYASTFYEQFSENLIIDDLGAERRMEFGEVKSEALDFIMEWHGRMSRRHPFQRRRLIITTNLRLSEIGDAYGGRMVDRLKQIGVPLRLWGGSKRKWIRYGE